MSEFLQVIALALMPAAGNFLGGLIAEVVEISRHRLSLALHAATGIILAVISVDLIPRALEGRPAWAVVAAFAAGVLVTGVVEEIIPEAHEEGEARIAALMLVGGFALFTLLSAYLG